MSTTNNEKREDTPFPSRTFGPGDVLVLFGEVFQRGYVNGLIEAAQQKGLTVIRSTVGRRDEQQSLRPLTTEESASMTAPWINVPLECGFDLEPDTQGRTPVSLCKDLSLKDGIKSKLDLTSIKESQEKGQARFRGQVRTWLQALQPLIPSGKNIIFAHLMAGGVPRAKIILGLMNRVFKGTGDRFLSSEDFWNSDLGRLCQLSFDEVTAESFHILIQETEALRRAQEASGGSVCYSAYGYHGTPIYNPDRELEWLTYTPYLQGFAKLKLEAYAQEHWSAGVPAVVTNCPEILTNSSSIFPGVEIFLYLILFEMEARNIQHPLVVKHLKAAHELLQEGALPKIKERITHYLRHPLFRNTVSLKDWPSHSNKEQMELMLSTSHQLIALHKDQNLLMTSCLSELIIHAAGAQMLDNLQRPQAPVEWLGHDAVIQYYEGSQ